MDIKEAFLNLLNDDDLIKKVGMGDSNRRQFLFKMSKEASNITGDVMRKWLGMAGFTEQSEWTLPSDAGIVVGGLD